MKKVWNPNENDLKILRYLHDFVEGSRANLIKKYTGLKTSTLYKRLNLLKDHGIIFDEYPLWKIVNGQVKFVESLLKSDKRMWELQNPAIIVRLPEIPKWWNPKGTQMKNKLMMVKGYQFQPVKDFGKNSSNPYIQLKSERHIIQTYPESVIIIFRKRYYSTENPYNVAIDFTNDFYDLWFWFEERMKFKFFKDGVPQGFLRGSDFNRIKDWMANKIKKTNGKGFEVKIGDGRFVKWDLSDPMGRETNTPEMQVIMEKDIIDKITNKPMLNSELQENLKTLREETTELSRTMLDRSLLSKQVNNRLDELQIQVLKLTEISMQINKRLDKFERKD